MDLKKKMKNFFALTRKADGGFTLVELIVVIAILAILGGVAVPAYSGYVKKAELAADEALLKEINTAFASACAINGEDHYNRTDNPAIVTGSDGISLNMGDAEIVESFAGFFSSEDSEFKVMQLAEIAYEKTFGGFQYNPGKFTLFVNGIRYTADAESVAAYLNSTLGQNMTSAEIADLAANIATGLNGAYADTYIAAIVSDAAYTDAVKSMLGIENYEAYKQEKIDAAKEAYLKENYPNYDEMDDWDKWDADDTAEAYAKEAWAATETNLIALVSTKKAEEASTTLISNLQSADAKQTIINNLTGTGSDGTIMGISQATLAFGLYTSYMESKGEEATLGGFTSALGDTGSGFNQYLGTDQATQDLEGLLGAMDVISGQDAATMESVANSGLNNADLLSALQQILGK